MISFFKIRLAVIFRRDRSESGVAMAMVIGVAGVMMLLIATMAAGSVSGSVKSSHDEDWNAAISAAYAGVADYQGRLANDYTYVQYGNPESKFGNDNDGRNVTLDATNPAFGVGQGGTWATVAGSGGNATYRYEVDNSTYSSTGVLKIRATGRVGTTVRSVVADLKQQGFIDYLWFTNFEALDPHLFKKACGTYGTTQYSWATSGGRPASCVIVFGADDEIDGPMHSNDTMVMCGGTFTGTVTTGNNIAATSGNNKGKLYSITGCGSNPPKPTFGAGSTGPVHTNTILFPSTNKTMSQETRTDLPLTVQRPGCLYTGPTTITYKGAFMTIRSPWTQYTEVAGDDSSKGSTPAMCGTPGKVGNTLAQNAGTLAGAAGVTIPVLDHNLVYVQNVPTVSTDKNYWATNVGPNKLSPADPGSRGTYCVGADGSTDGNGVGFPVATEVADPDALKPAYDCKSGDVFVKGTFDAAMTIAAEHYVYVTGDLVRQDTQNDILGLVGDASVWVWNPMNSSSKPVYPSDVDRQIDAAIVSTTDSFQVQNYSMGGARGTLTVNGSIAQLYRGTVASPPNGYIKNYTYDTRLRAIAPPKFLNPVSTTYGVNVMIEVKSAFTAAGVAVP